MAMAVCPSNGSLVGSNASAFYFTGGPQTAVWEPTAKEIFTFNTSSCDDLFISIHTDSVSFCASLFRRDFLCFYCLS